jgi:signal transduction histidine kinase
MTTERSSQRFINLGTAIAVGVVVVTAAVSAALAGPQDARIQVITASALALVGLTAGMSWAEGQASPLALRTLFAALLGLGAYLIAASDITALLVVMPIISMAVLYQSTLWGVLVTAAYTAEVGWLLRDRGPAAIVQASAGFVAAGAFVVVFSRLMRRERQARNSVELLAAQLERANTRLAEYATQIEDLATTKERNRLAREIHDSLGHFLTVVHVQIEAAKTHLNKSPALAAECLASAQKLTDEGLADVRRSVALLRAAPTESKPLTEAVTRLVDECRAAGLEADLVVSGSPRPLAPPIEFALYRAVQEALTNARRHAHAHRAKLDLAYDDGAVQLRVRDDGVGASGFDGGFGLLGMRERVQLVGGTVKIETAVGAGFAIEVRVPA